MIYEFNVVEPANQAELMESLNRTKAGSAVLDIVATQSGDEFSVRRRARDGIAQLSLRMTIDSINDINGTPFVIGKIDSDDSSAARLEVVRDNDCEDRERPLHLTVATDNYLGD